MRIFDSSEFINIFFQNSQYLRNFQFTIGSAVLFSINIQKIKIIVSIVELTQR
jgi:hypothetical protein